MPDYMFEAAVSTEHPFLSDLVRLAFELAGGIYAAHAGGRHVRIAVKLQSEEFVSHLRGRAVDGVIREASQFEPLAEAGHPDEPTPGDGSD